VDLREAGIGEESALPVCSPGGRRVATLGVRRQVESVAVATGGEHDGIGHVGFDLPRHHVASHDAASRAVDDDELQHLVAWEALHRSGAHLTCERLVGAEQKLLSGLAASVERAGHLRATERPVVEQAAVLASEGHALRHALVDDVHRHLGEAVHVALAGAEVTALHRVVEETVDAVAVVLVVLRGVDAALGSDAVGAARAVLVTERQHVVAHLAERRGAGTTCETGADDDDRVLPAVGRIDELHFETVAIPARLDRTRRSLGLELDGHLSSSRHFTKPATTATGMAMFPAATTTPMV
jgi:hypothetical protein